MNQLAKIEYEPFPITRPMTFREILDLMEANDAGTVTLSSDDMRALAEKAEVKVDGYYQRITQLEAEASRLDMIAKDFSKASKSAKGEAEALEKLMLRNMQEKGVTTMPGKLWKVRIKTSKAVKVRLAAESSEYLEHADFMRLKYEWDKVKLTAALKAGDLAAMGIAEFEEHHKVEFVVSKGDGDE